MKSETNESYLAAESMNASFQGDTINTVASIMGSVSAQWTESVATLGGTVKLQGSNNGSDWDDITDTDETVSGTGQHTWNLTEVGYSCLRVAWVSSTGQGTMDAQYTMKG